MVVYTGEATSIGGHRFQIGGRRLLLAEFRHHRPVVHGSLALQGGPVGHRYLILQLGELFHDGRRVSFHEEAKELLGVLVVFFRDAIAGR